MYSSSLKSIIYSSYKSFILLLSSLVLLMQIILYFMATPPPQIVNWFLNTLDINLDTMWTDDVLFNVYYNTIFLIYFFFLSE